MLYAMEIMTQYRYSKYWKYFIELSSADTELEVAFLETILKNHLASKVIDIACGTGRHSIALSLKNFETLGLDYSKFQIQEARKNTKIKQASSKFLIKDVNAFLFPPVYDAAFCMWSTIGEEPLQYQKVIKNVYASLKPEGIFIIDNKNWTSYSKEKTEKISSIDENGVKITRKIIDRFTNNLRVRICEFNINGEEFEELWVTYTKTPEEWVAILKEGGFKKFEIYYDYKPEVDKSPKRVQIIAVK